MSRSAFARLLDEIRIGRVSPPTLDEIRASRPSHHEQGPGYTAAPRPGRPLDRFGDPIEPGDLAVNATGRLA